MIKLKILGWAYYPGLSRWAQCDYKDPYQWGRHRVQMTEGDVMEETQVRVMEWLAFRNRGKSHEPRNASGL